MEASGDFGLLLVLPPRGVRFLGGGGGGGGGGGAGMGLISLDPFSGFFYPPCGLLRISLLWLFHCIAWDFSGTFHIFARGVYCKTLFPCHPLNFSFFLFLFLFYLPTYLFTVFILFFIYLFLPSPLLACTPSHFHT